MHNNNNSHWILSQDVHIQILGKMSLYVFLRSFIGHQDAILCHECKGKYYGNPLVFHSGLLWLLSLLDSFSIPPPPLYGKATEYVSKALPLFSIVYITYFVKRSEKCLNFTH